MLFTELNIGAFRALVDIHLPLQPLNVLVGPNSAGKTSLLETFLFLQAIANDKLQEIFIEFGGIGSLVPAFSNESPRVRLGTEMSYYKNKKEIEKVWYQIMIAAQNNGAYSVEEEEVRVILEDAVIGTRNQEPRTPNLRGMVKSPNIVALPRVVDSSLQKFREQIKLIRFYRPVNVARNTPIRIPQTLIPTTEPGANGETLFATLYNLRENYPDQFEYIKDVLRTAFPGFQDLSFPTVGAGVVTLGWRQAELTRILYPNELSEGTLRFLWLTTLLLSPEPAPLTLIDEPEVSLHPQLFQILAGLFQTAALRGQVIVATQSADLIRWLEPADIVIADKEDGRVRFTRGNAIPNIKEWLSDFTLAELWQMGVLGGQP